MYTKRALSQDQCQAAIASVIAEFKKSPDSSPWTMAIVDDAGNLLAFTRSERAGPMLGRNCIKKAYTSAMTGSSTPPQVSVNLGRLAPAKRTSRRI